MNNSPTDRILTDWDRISRQAQRPSPPHRAAVTTALPVSMIASAAVLAVVVAASTWLGLPRGGGSPGGGSPGAGASGAGSPGPGASVSPAVSTAGPWGTLAVVPPSNGVMEALAAGTLRITESCVFLEEAGDDLLLLVWPADRTTWSADPPGVTIRNLDGTSVTLRDGDRISLGGGGDSLAEGGVSGVEWVRKTVWVAPPALTCPLDARWFVGEVVTDR
ncbi:MAG: hypothetical protein H0V74_05405 [Chloroflexi bacterium]|nr:hypothetical protein [Chloroflexota bacterium]